MRPVACLKLDSALTALNHHDWRRAAYFHIHFMAQRVVLLLRLKLGFSENLIKTHLKTTIWPHPYSAAFLLCLRMCIVYGICAESATPAPSSQSSWCCIPSEQLPGALLTQNTQWTYGVNQPTPILGMLTPDYIAHCFTVPFVLIMCDGYRSNTTRE